MTTLSIDLDEKTRSDLDALASMKHQPVDTLVKMAIETLILEEREFQEDDERWEEYMRNGGIEANRVVDWLDQWAKGNRQPCPQ